MIVIRDFLTAAMADDSCKAEDSMVASPLSCEEGDIARCRRPVQL